MKSVQMREISSNTRISSTDKVSPADRSPLLLTQAGSPQPQVIQSIIRPGQDSGQSTCRAGRRSDDPVVNIIAAPFLGENGEAQDDLSDRNQDTDDDEYDDDPCDRAHLGVGNRVREDLGKVQEDAASLVEHLGARVDLEVVADGDVQGMQRGLCVPEEVGHIENIRRCKKTKELEYRRSTVRTSGNGGSFYVHRFISTRLLNRRPRILTISVLVILSWPVKASRFGTSWASVSVSDMRSSKKHSFVLCAMA